MPAPAGLSAQDLVTLGEDLRALGITESRAVVAELQEICAQTALRSADVFMNRLRRVVQARDAELIRAIQMLQPLRLPAMLTGPGQYISRDAVLVLIQRISAATGDRS